MSLSADEIELMLETPATGPTDSDSTTLEDIENLPDTLLDKPETSDMTLLEELDTLDVDSELTDSILEKKITVDDTEILSEDEIDAVLDIAEESLEDDIDLSSEEEMESLLDSFDGSDNKTISTDPKGIKSVEFGILAKGFILTVTMMETMIEKGYVLRDVIDNKKYPAVMILENDFDNPIESSDISFNISDGKITLVRN